MIPSTKHILHLVLTGMAAIFLGAAPQQTMAQADRALAVGDEQTALYQRILSRPGAELLDRPGGAVIRELAPFQVYYVYQRDDRFIRVGTKVEGGAAGYIETARTLDWNSSIVATYNNRVAAARERIMIFQGRDDLEDLIRTEDVATTATAYRERAIAGEPLDGSGVISIEPEENVDIREQLYILPIMDAQQVRLPGRNRGKMLRIAAMSAHEGADSDADHALKDFRVEIAVVIDTTRSMQPYIDQTRDALAEFAEKVGASDVAASMSFALVEFRDNIDLAPGLEYVTEIRQDFSDTPNLHRFVEAISNVRATDVSSDGFNEDAIAGLHRAITDLSWSGDAGARMIYLVTDAAPRIEETTIPNLSEAELRGLADEKQIAVVTWHLRTSGGSFDHAAAEASYRQLSAMGVIDAYRPVELGDPNVFEDMLDDAIKTSETIVEAAQAGKRADQILDLNTNDPVVQLGLALQFAYLGRTTGVQVPDVFEGWMLDRGIPDFKREGLDIRMMLTRNQFSTLSSVVQTIIEKLDAGLLDPASFFEELQTALALLATDTDRIAQAEIGVLGDAVNRLLGDLPYRSDIMAMTQEDWLSLSGGEQVTLKNRLASKLQAYREIYDDPSLWTALDDSAPEGERVSLIKLDLMP